jgi:hypothetical protein
MKTKEKKTPKPPYKKPELTVASFSTERGFAMSGGVSLTPPPLDCNTDNNNGIEPDKDGGWGRWM